MLKGFKIAAVAAAVAISSASEASAQSLNGFLKITVSGDRGWVMRCTFERDGKDAIENRAVGSSRVVSLVARGVTGGSCAYEGPRRGSVTVRFLDENGVLACPFSEIDGVCIGSIAAKAEGSFRF